MVVMDTRSGSLWSSNEIIDGKNHKLYGTAPPASISCYWCDTKRCLVNETSWSLKQILTGLGYQTEYRMPSLVWNLNKQWVFFFFYYNHTLWYLSFILNSNLMGTLHFICWIWRPYQPGKCTWFSTDCQDWSSETWCCWHKQCASHLLLVRNVAIKRSR